MSIDSAAVAAGDGGVVYKAIPGFPGYAAGSDGTIWSSRWRRKNGVTLPGLAGEWNLLKAACDKDGYGFYDLRSATGKYLQRKAHRLVLETFVGPCPPGLIACHNDGCRANNHLSNLRWDTYSANERDKVGHGTVNVFENVTTKLNQTKVAAIRQLRAVGWTYEELAVAFGVAPATVDKVVRRVTWRQCV